MVATARNLISSICVISLFVSPILVEAATLQNSPVQESLSITPMAFHLNYQPGQLNVQYIKISNTTDRSRKISVQYDDSWIFIFPTEFTLQDGESREIIAGFLFPTDIKTLADAGNKIVFKSGKQGDVLQIPIQVAVSKNQVTAPPQPQIPEVQQPAQEITQNEEIPAEQKDRLLVTPQAIELPVNVSQLFVSEIRIKNTFSSAVQIVAEYDTSWIVTIPKRFELQSGSEQTVKAIFIGTEFSRVDTASHPAIRFVQSRSGYSESVALKLEPPREVATDFSENIPNTTLKQPAIRRQNQPAQSPTTEKNSSKSTPEQQTTPPQQQSNQITDHSLQSIYSILSDSLTKEIQNNDLSLILSRYQLIIAIAGQNTFDVGALQPKESGQHILRKVGEVLKQQLVDSMVVFVYGNTDTLPIIRPVNVNSNWDLSAVRASGVVYYLQNITGINGRFLWAVGRSSFSPVAENSTAEGRTRNRRLEIVVTFRTRVGDVLQ